MSVHTNVMGVNVTKNEQESSFQKDQISNQNDHYVEYTNEQFISIEQVISKYKFSETNPQYLKINSTSLSQFNQQQEKNEINRIGLLMPNVTDIKLIRNNLRIFDIKVIIASKLDHLYPDMLSGFSNLHIFISQACTITNDELNISLDIKHIPARCFKNCSFSIANLNNVEEVDLEAFCPSQYLKRIKGQKVRILKDRSLMKCEALELADFPLAREVGSQCFKFAGKLRLKIFSGLREIPEQLLSYSAIRYVSFHSVVKIIELGLSECEQLEVASFNNVEHICQNAFYKCLRLRIVSALKLKILGTNAFYYCNNQIILKFGQPFELHPQDNIAKLKFLCCGPGKIQKVYKKYEQIRKCIQLTQGEEK